MQAFCFSSSFFVLQRKRKQNVVWCTMTTGNGLKNLQRSDTKCWGQGRQCGSESNIEFCDEEEPAYEKEQDTHTHTQREREREREIGTKKRYIPIATVTKWQPNLTKGYKVTLYSDYLRATVLYTIYRKSLNLDCPRDSVNTAIIHLFDRCVCHTCADKHRASIR